MIAIALPLLVCVAGLVLYFASAKAQHIGLVMFAAGLLVTLFLLGAHPVRL